jgi:uncharacterized membrane protein
MKYIAPIFLIGLIVIMIGRLIWAVVMYFKTREEDKE